jgi:hypothetical protein
VFNEHFDRFTRWRTVLHVISLLSLSVFSIVGGRGAGD